MKFNKLPYKIICEVKYMSGNPSYFQFGRLHLSSGIPRVHASQPLGQSMATYRRGARENVTS